MSPEILSAFKYDKPCDVYAYAFIIYEVITDEKTHYNNIPNFEYLSQLVIQGKRQEIKETTPECYKELIKKHNGYVKRT